MLNIEEISDRLEIQQLLAQYCTAIDSRRFDDLDDLFTADAEVDLSATGGAAGPFAEVKAWLMETLGGMGPFAHLVSNSDLRVDGDTARARTLCANPLVLDAKTNAVYLLWFWYEDEFAKTAEGWRFRRRGQVKCIDKLM